MSTQCRMSLYESRLCLAGEGGSGRNERVSPAAEGSRESHARAFHPRIKTETGDYSVDSRQSNYVSRELGRPRAAECEAGHSRRRAQALQSQIITSRKSVSHDGSGSHGLGPLKGRTALAVCESGFVADWGTARTPPQRGSQMSGTKQAGLRATTMKPTRNEERPRPIQRQINTWRSGC